MNLIEFEHLRFSASQVYLGKRCLKQPGETCRVPDLNHGEFFPEVLLATPKDGQQKFGIGELLLGGGFKYF